ncbi:MAG: S8 family serine peptidase [Chloroflexota bacterium]
MNPKRIPRLLSTLVLVLVTVLTGTAAIAAPAPPDAFQGRYIVVFHDGVDVDAAVQDLAAAHGMEVAFVYRHALKGMAAQIPTGRLNALRHDPRVAYVEVDQEVHLFAQTIPTGVQRIFADENSNIDIDNTDDYRVDVDVAIIDTGIDFEHPDLNVVGGVDCSGGGPFGGSCSSGGDDDHYHGTHVAGTVAAIDDGSGVVGVAPGARLWAVKVLDQRGSGYESWIVAGIDWVAANAATIEVANMSLGGSGFSQAEYDAIQGAVNEGVAFAVAAGNSDDDANNYSPAAFDNVLTVSALADFDGEPGGLGSPTCRDDQDDTLADFSNWGDAVQIAAPGVCILSTFPIEEGEYGTISGTSMASPHAAGALALLASANNPGGANDVYNLYDQVINAGNFDWTDDSGDGIQEPLLDVSTFNPVLVDGGGTTDDPPTVGITNPTDGATVSGTVFVTADASDDNAVSQVEFFVDGGSIGVDSDGSDGWSASWDTTAYADGSHTVSATATDTAGQTASDSVSVTVDNDGGGEGGGMYVWDISWRETGPHLKATVTILVDSDGDGVAEDTDDPVSGATVDFTLTNDTTEDTQDYTGTTDSTGIVEFQWKRAPSGTYTGEVTDLTHSSYTWDPTLDVDNPDTYTKN